MRFNVTYVVGKQHAELASAVSWDNGSLVSGSDDQTVQRWSGSGLHQGQVGLYLGHLHRRARCAPRHVNCRSAV